MTGANPPPRDREEQAAGYFARRLDDGTAALRAEVEAWLSADPRNAVAYARIADAWDKAAGLRAVLPAPDHDPSPPGGAPPHGADQQ